MSLARRLRRKHANATMDWVAGVVAVESQAVGEPPSAIAVWMQDGQVLGQRPAPAPDLHDWDSPDGPGIALVQLLLEIVEQKTGPAPLRVRIEAPECAQFLRRFAPPFVTVVCAPTPELNRWFETRLTEVPASTAPHALDFRELPSLERLASEIFEIKPWFFVAPLTVFHLRAPALGLENAALTFLAERNGQASVYVFAQRAELEATLRSGISGAFDALPGCELAFERKANLGADERRTLTEAGWWFPADDPDLQPRGRYQEGRLEFRPLTERELEVLRVGMFALQSMFGETVHSVDVTRDGVIGSWTVKLSGDRCAYVELRWPANPEKGLAFFLPENTQHFIRHRDRILRRLGIKVP